MHKNAGTSEPITRGRTLDHVAWIYDFLSPPMMFFQESRLAKKVIEMLNLRGNEKVLDVGCGTGSLTIEIAKKLSAEMGGLAVGLDAAPKMIEIAKKKVIKKHVETARFDFGAAERLEYGDAFFDHAVSTFFFHHIDFELKEKAFNELWRVLKPAGKAVIIDVDIPQNIFGALCAWSGYILFRQSEIKENIQGKLRMAITLSQFKTFKIVSCHLGYISILELFKGE